MQEIIKSLQKEVYRIDFRIGQAASDLQLDLESENQRKRGDIEFYNQYVHKRNVILDCIERLKQIM